MTAVTFKSNWKHHALSDMVVTDPLQVYALIIGLSSPRDVHACGEFLNASFEQTWRLYTVQARQHIATTYRVIPFGFRKVARIDELRKADVGPEERRADPQETWIRRRRTSA